MKILKITLLESDISRDIVFLETDLPEQLYPFKDNMKMTFECSSMTGREYIRKYFKNIPLEIINPYDCGTCEHNKLDGCSQGRSYFPNGNEHLCKPTKKKKGYEKL